MQVIEKPLFDSKSQTIKKRSLQVLCDTKQDKMAKILNTITLKERKENHVCLTNKKGNTGDQAAQSITKVLEVKIVHVIWMEAVSLPQGFVMSDQCWHSSPEAFTSDENTCLALRMKLDKGVPLQLAFHMCWSISDNSILLKQVQRNTQSIRKGWEFFVYD